MADAKKVMGYFNKSAEAFDSLYSEDRQSPFMRFVNRKFRSDIYERFIMTVNHISKYSLNTALDVGCGPGRYAYALGQLGIKKIVGIDISPRMVELSIVNAKDLPDADKVFRFICSDFEKFQTEERFDVVIAMGFFDYIKEPILIFKKMRALSNHSVVASFPSISFYRTPLRKIRYYFKRCPVYFYKRDDIISLSSKAGFARCEVIKIKGSGMDYWVAFYK